MTNKRKIIGWVAKNQPPKETAEQRQKAEWLRQKKDVEDASPASPWATEEKGPSLLEGIEPSPVTDPKGFSDVLQERIRWLNK